MSTSQSFKIKTHFITYLHIISFFVTLHTPLYSAPMGIWNHKTNKLLTNTEVHTRKKKSREQHQKLPSAEGKLYFSRTKQKWNMLVKFTSCIYNFGYELNSNISFPQWEKLECDSWLDGVPTWDEDCSCSLKDLQAPSISPDRWGIYAPS